MNKKQIAVMWVAIIIIMGMVVYPPWYGILKTENSRTKRLQPINARPAPKVERAGYNYRYSLLWDSPGQIYRLDIYRLIIQVGTVSVVASGFLITLKDRK